MNNEQKDQFRFYTIILVVTMLFVMACTFAGFGLTYKQAYIDRTPVTCQINPEEGLCLPQGG